MQEGKLSKILSQTTFTADDLHRKSAVWFERKVFEFRDVKNLREESLLRGNASLKRTNIIPGEMYLYIYEAKHAQTLPDRKSVV